MLFSTRCKIYKNKSYAHFDAKLHWRYIYKQVEDPEFVQKHGFYPFIYYVQKSEKFPKKFKSTDGERSNPKLRPIMYSAHIDRYIYEYYSWLWNMKYNEVAKSSGINNCVIAYRQQNGHRSNIHFAKEVFSFIKSLNECTIIVGDFTEYFDHIDHAYLKTRLCEILGAERLPDDYFAVFKSITKYAYIERDKIIETKGITRRQFFDLSRVFSTEEFHKYKSLIQKNQHNYGIPQGSAISAFFSNAYMFQADKTLNNFITGLGGLYRRYCDDFVVVIPSINKLLVNKVWSVIKDTLSAVGQSGVDLNQNKTKVFTCIDNKIESKNCLLFENPTEGANLLSYLGFTFDGESIRIRQKTIAKFYSRMYRKIDRIKELKGKSKNGKIIPMSNLYRLYSHYGVNPKGRWKKRYKGRQGNFLKYVEHADSVFGNESGIGMDTKRAWSKLQKRLHSTKNNK